MISSKFTQSLLVVIALLLTWLAIRPYASTTVVHASTPVQYKVIYIATGADDLGTLEMQFNALGKDGWVLVQCVGGFNYCAFKR